MTIERDKEKAELAKNYIERANLQNRIQVIIGDALEISDELGRYEHLMLFLLMQQKANIKIF